MTDADKFTSADYADLVSALERNYDNATAIMSNHLNVVLAALRLAAGNAAERVGADDMKASLDFAARDTPFGRMCDEADGARNDPKRTAELYYLPQAAFFIT